MDNFIMVTLPQRSVIGIELSRGSYRIEQLALLMT